MKFWRQDYRGERDILVAMREQMLNSKSELDHRNWRIFLAWLNEFTYEDLGVTFGMSKHNVMMIIHKCCRRYNQIKKEAA